MDYRNALLIIIPLIVSIIIRISITFKYMGFDTYEIYWMANAIRDGALNTSNDTWLVNILSYFGFFPFSHYPIGVPLLFSLILSSGVNVNIASFFFTLITISIMYFGTLKLSKNYFENKTLQLVFCFLFVNIPVFFNISFMTVHPRAMFLAVLPWFLYYLDRFFIKFNIKDFLFLVLFLILLTLTHRVWLGVIGYIVLGIITKILLKLKLQRKINFSKKLSIFIIFAIIIINIVFLFLSFYIFSFDTTKINSPWFSNQTFFGMFLNLGLDYSTRLGPLIIVIPISIVNYNIKAYNLLTGKLKNTDENQIRILYVSIFSMFLISLTFIFTLYSTVLFLPILVIYIIDGVRYLYYRFRKNRFILVTLFSLFNLIICYFYMKAFSITISWLELIILILGILLMIILTTFLIIKYSAKHDFISRIKSKFQIIKIKKYYNIILLFFIIAFFSVNLRYTTLANSENQLPYDYISDEELEIIDVINNEGINGSIFVYHTKIAKHINSYSNIPTIKGFHRPQQLYYNWINLDIIVFQIYFFKTVIFNL